MVRQDAQRSKEEWSAGGLSLPPCGSTVTKYRIDWASFCGLSNFNTERFFALPEGCFLHENRRLASSLTKRCEYGIMGSSINEFEIQHPVAVVHQTATFADFQRRFHYRGGEYHGVIFAALSASIYATRFEKWKHFFRELSAQPFFVKQRSSGRDNLCLGPGFQKLAKQESSLFSPQRLDRFETALRTDPLDPEPVLIEEDVPEYDMRKFISRVTRLLVRDTRGGT